MKPISVIVPAFNASPYLDAALGSIAGQTKQPDEVVVLDDASDDDSAAIARQWADILPLEVICKARNEGLGAARRTAIEQAKGELIALLDADDVWFPEHLEIMTRRQRETQAGIVTAAGFRWWPGHKLDTLPTNRLNVVPPEPEQQLEILRRNFLFIATLFDREEYERVGGFSTRRKDEDWDLWIRMIRAGSRVVTTDVVTVLYRQRVDSLSANDGCLDHDIELLSSLEDLDANEAPVVKDTLRRLHARKKLVDGYQLARDGDIRGARRLWAKAVIEDRSLRRGVGQTGSQSLRAAACMIAPRQVVSYRDRRLGLD
jgi:glycosyltransferase involved in cell wall biosynthesis